MHNIQWRLSISAVSWRNTRVLLFVDSPRARCASRARMKTSLSGKRSLMNAANAERPDAHQKSERQVCAVSGTSVRLITAASR